jgi:hypothetical protein
MAPPIAMCPRCVVPLVMTMAWSKAEFYCLDCGAHLGFVSPVPADERERLLEQVAARKAEFERLGGNDLIRPAATTRPVRAARWPPARAMSATSRTRSARSTRPTGRAREAREGAPMSLVLFPPIQEVRPPRIVGHAYQNDGRKIPIVAQRKDAE